MNIKFDRETKLCAQVGYPMKHTVVSKIHNALYQRYDVNAVYLPFEVPPESFDDFIKAVKVMGLKGFAVTMPHKGTVVKYLDYVHPVSQVYGSVCIVQVDEEGKLHGYSSDGICLRQSIEDAGFCLEGKNVLILGAGRIVGVICDALAEHGAKSITILNRTVEKADKIADLVHTRFDLPIHTAAFTPENLDAEAEKCDIILQCTSMGLPGVPDDYEYLGFIDHLRDDVFVADVIFNPPVTKFLAKAQERGLKTINGERMALYPCMFMLRDWFGIDAGEDGFQFAIETLHKVLAGEL